MMKHNTKYILLASVLSLVAATACQRDELTDRTPVGEDILKFSVGFAGSGEIVLSKGATLASEDGTVSIPLSCTVTDGIEVNLPDAVTKGTQINSEGEFLGAELTSFTAAGWSADKTEFIPLSTAVSYSDGLWQTAGTYRWRGSDNKTFLAYANLPASGATVTNSADPVKQTFTYTVPTDARQQNDIMLGWYEGNGGGTATAAITMVHPLTAVVFKAGEIDESITAIKDISIEGVYTSGKADVTYELSGSDIVPTYDWKAGTVADTRTGSQTVTLAPLSPAEKLEIDEDDNTIGVPFIVLPQTVAAGTLTLKITVVKDGEEAVLLAAVPAGQWQEGKTNTFTIGYIGQYVDLGLSVKWGNFNLGASKREGYGEYYSWAGRVNVASTSINLDFSNCPYHTGSDQKTGWKKYNSLSGYGTVDNKNILDLDDDVAHLKKQGPWHMPTEAQWQELIDNCTWDWVDDYNGTGVAGMKVTSKITGYTDRYIFLPAAGYRTGEALKDVGTICNYWYPQMKADNTYGAYYVYISKTEPHTKYNNNRYTGRPVRPVYDDIPKTITAKPASGCESMGTVSGSGSYLFSETATLSATPADGYVFSKWNDGVTTATRTITVTADATYEAIFETNPVLPGKFSVSPTEYVQFSRGNLFCTDNGTSASPRYTFNFERNQYDFRLRNSAGEKSIKNGSLYTVPENESGMFQWNKSNAVNGNDYGAFSTGSPFGDNSDHIDWGKTISEKWFTLNTDQWNYLIARKSSTGKSLISWAVVGGIDGLVLAPDNYSGFDSDYFTCTLSEWQSYESNGFVFLPGCGELSMGQSHSMERGSYYSTSDPDLGTSPRTDNANFLCASCSEESHELSCSVGNASRSSAHPVRLVQKVVLPTAKVSFSMNGGTGSAPASQDVTIGSTAALSAPTGDCKKEGHNFVRWNTKSDGSGQSYHPGDQLAVSEDITLYAQYGAVLIGDGFNGKIGAATQKIIFGNYNVWSSTVGDWSGGTNVGSGADESLIKLFTVGTTTYVLSKYIIVFNSDCHDMFTGKTYVTGIDFGNGIIDTHNVSTIRFVFARCSSLTSIDLTEFDTSSLTEMFGLFQNCTSLTTIYADSSWDTSKVTSHSDNPKTFENCSSSLRGGAGTTWNSSHTGIDYAHIDGQDGHPGYFTLKAE